MRFDFDSFMCEEGKVLLRDMGFSPLEEVRVGGYDLILILHNPTQTYHLALQKVGLDFTDLSQQKIRIPNAPVARVTEFKPILSRWVRDHGKLLLSSHNKSRNKSYEKIMLRLGFRVTKFNHRDQPMMFIE